MSRLTPEAAHVLEELVREVLSADGDELLGFNVYPRGPKDTRIGGRTIKVIREHWVLATSIRDNEGVERDFRVFVDDAGTVVDSYEVQ